MLNGKKLKEIPQAMKRKGMYSANVPQLDVIT
jgi:hypothetical protein